MMLIGSSGVNAGKLMWGNGAGADNDTYLNKLCTQIRWD